MSEYQYHEWQAIDRVLTPEEQDAVYDLSSHIEVSSSRAVVTYHWSDFRHDPKQVLLKYFDAYFYLANWGSLRLMFRFPKGLLEEADILPIVWMSTSPLRHLANIRRSTWTSNLKTAAGGWKPTPAYRTSSACAPICWKATTGCST